MDIKNLKMNENIAELYGAMIGDGCLSRYFSNYDKRVKFCTLLTGHTHDEPYYRKALQSILKKEFDVVGYIRFKRKDNVTRFETMSKKVFDFFKNFGFPIGLKKRLVIPDIIIEDDKLSLSCVRGIFDTDGSIYRRYSKNYKRHTKLYNYQVIQIKLNSKIVIRQIKKILERNNIKTNKIICDKKSFVLRITNQKEIFKFIDKVKPNNKYHIERFLNNINSQE